MKIKNLKLKNISSYAGENSFDFSVTNEKTIILIGGQNGAGKTSLFSAIKIALYGHLSFNYVSANPQYFSKVREMINNDTFVKDEVNAYVEIEIELPMDNENKIYVIKREWNYVSRRINEVFTVSVDNKRLKDDEIVLFQNYLFTIMPPNLFDFFFFDGEQIADFFATNKYNSYVKTSFLTLCSVDTFETIYKFSKNYISSNDSDDEATIELTQQFEAIQAEIQEAKDRIYEYEQNINLLNTELLQISENKLRLTNEFKNAGGLSQKEKEKLFDDSKKYEKIKSESNYEIRNFIENEMPFIITKEFAKKIKNTIDSENEYNKVIAIKEKLSSENISFSLGSLVDKYKIESKDTLVDEIINLIVDEVSADVDTKGFVKLHDLSKDELEKVQQILMNIENFDKVTILDLIETKENATIKTIEINKQFRESMVESDTEMFTKEIESLTVRELKIQNEIEVLSENIIERNNIVETSTLKATSVKNLIIENSKERNIYDLTERIRNATSNIIDRVSALKFKEVEAEMTDMLTKLMRKDNFIDLVELDSEFNINVYKEQSYQISEIKNLVDNIGDDELERRIGILGVKKLLEYFNIESISELKSIFESENELNDSYNQENINLYKKLEFNLLSKGEKQIFILSLYYGMIKVSKKDIPFIIDTPYARIDTEHREQISKEFLPNISKQVIILSTDEEITLPYHTILEPFIAKEYLLQYNEAESKTMISSGYFYKEQL